MTTHSPAPWEAWFEKNEEGFIVSAGVDTADREANICVTTCEDVEPEDIETANAYIIGDTMLLAAAPELLASCKALVAIHDDPHHVTDSRIIDAARRAIAKTEGQPNV